MWLFPHLKSLTSHVFATLTFTRDISLDSAWEQTNTNFNRYIQKFRRQSAGNEIQYIRTVEAHLDSYPHIHTILQFHSPISVDNARYFDPTLYRKWKQLWTFGISDYQPPRSSRLPILYLIKYISKGNTTKTIWKKMFANATATADSKPSPAPSVKVVTTTPTQEFCKKYNIKQCTWSRKFTFPVLNGVGGVPHGDGKQSLLRYFTK